MKTISQKKLKQSVWKLFSEYIRTKECIETTGSIEYGVCCTCGKVYLYDKLQAGHFIPGRTNSVLFVEDIVHIQCWQCNGYEHGKYFEYEQYMINRYGQEKVEKLKILKHQHKTMKIFELLAIEQYYKEKLLKLKQENNLL